MAKLKHRNIKAKIRKNFSIINTINSIKKIDDIDKFTSEIKRKLLNPIFQASFYFNKGAYCHSLFNHNSCIKKSKFEHDWVLLTLKANKESKLINQFINLRDKYEDSVLRGDLNSALEHVNEIYKLSGLSYWYIENKMSLLSYMDRGTELVEFYNQEISRKTRGIQSRELGIIFERAANKVPSDRIDFTLDSLLEGLKRERIEDNVIDYYVINFVHRFNCSADIDYDNILRFFWQCNIIDIYQVLVRVLNTINSDPNSEYDAKYLVSTFNSQFCDYKINNIIKITSNDLSLSDRDKVFSEICDEYIRGNFDSVIALSEDALEKWPGMATIYEFYLNSIFNTKSTIGISRNGVLYKILNSALRFISSRGGDNFNEMNKIVYQFPSIDACQFICLLKEKLDVSKEKRNVGKIYRFLDVSSSPINPFDRNINNSLCSKLSDEDVFMIRNPEIPEYRYKKRLADAYYDVGDYRAAVDIFGSIVDAPLSMIDEINNKKILSFIMMGDIESGVKELVELYFNYDLNTLRLDIKSIIKEIDSYEDELPKCIELVIAIYILVDAGKLDLQIISLYLDDYLDHIEVNSPSDINPSNKKEEFLLSKVCGLEVLEGLHLSRFLYKSTSDLMLDRVLMLSKVSSNYRNATSSEKIRKEINFLVHQYARNLCLKNVGKGKIYVNREMLFKIISLEMADLFDSIKISLETELDIFENSEAIDVIKENPNSQTFILSYQFLLEVRDLYTLDGRYGLDNSLNTDIRHNGIVPRLRSVFEGNNIICNKEFDEYIDNPEVKAIYKHLLVPYFYNKLQLDVKDFSKKIDLRLNKLKSVYMHINTNDKDDKDKLFKFIINETDVATFISLMISDMTFEEIIEWSLNKMEKKTEDSMKVGRAVIENALKDAFGNHIDELKSKVIKSSSNKKTNFTENLSLVKNQLESTLNEVSEWLSFAEKTGDNFKIETPIYEALSFVKKLFSTVYVNLALEVNSSFTYNGKYLNSFIKIFILLLENAIKSRDNIEQANIKVFVNETSDKLLLRVDNDAKSVDLKIIDEINKNINNLDSTIKANREKGSGIYKVKKICEIDISTDNVIQIEANNNYFSFNLCLCNKILGENESKT